MGRFNYKVRIENDIVQGCLHSTNIEEAADILEKKGYTIIELKEEKTSYNKKIYASMPILTLKEKKDFFNTFYFLFKSGLPILEICSSGSKSAINQSTKFVFNEIYNDIFSGKTIEETFKTHSKSLGYAYSMLVVAGEQSGKLENSLLGILNNIKKQEKLYTEIKKRAWYPITLIGMTIFAGLMYVFFFNNVFPKMMDGLTTSDVLGILASALIKIAIIFAIIIFTAINIYKNKNLTNKIIDKLSKTKLLKNTLNAFYFSNFFAIFSLGYDAGLSISDTMKLANHTIDSKQINKKIDEARRRIEQGCEVSTALEITGLFNDFAISQTITGEQSGELDKALKTISLEYEKELNENTDATVKCVHGVVFVVIALCASIILFKGWSAYFNGLLNF